VLNGAKLSARHLASMGKTMGTPCISGVIDIWKCKKDFRARTRVFFVGVYKFCLAAIVQQEDTLSEALPINFVKS
jgi:hypothetical protein